MAHTPAQSRSTADPHSSSVRGGLRLAGGLALVALASLSMHRATVWEDERDLWHAAVQHSPTKPRPWINLGNQYARQHMDGPAEDAFLWASHLTQQPGRSREEQYLGWAVADTNVALMLLRRGDLAQARQVVGVVVAFTPFHTPKRVLAWIERRSPSSPAPFF